MDKRLEKILLILMAVAFVFLLVFSNQNTASAKESQLENQYPGIIRFHVIANSDTTEDQQLKLKVRDYVLKMIHQDLNNNQNAREYIYGNLDKIQEWAEDGLKINNSSYKCETSIGVRHIPAKYYDDLLFPEGNYEALTITIGQGEGQNWWCVVFPPLCLASVTEEVVDAAAEAGLTEEQISLITGQDGEYVLKFKLIEWWEELLEKLKK